MKSRVIIALFFAATLTILSATQSREVSAQSTAPMLTGATQMIKVSASQTTTEIPGVGNSLPAFGGNLVAFIHGDLMAMNSFEIKVYEESIGRQVR